MGSACWWRGKEPGASLPGEADDFHQQLGNTEQHLLGSQHLRSLMFPVGNTAMNAELSASPFQLSGQESARKAKADLFSCFVAGRVGQSNKANAIMEFALHPPGCE